MPPAPTASAHSGGQSPERPDRCRTELAGSTWPGDAAPGGVDRPRSRSASRAAAATRRRRAGDRARGDRRPAPRPRRARISASTPTRSPSRRSRTGSASSTTALATASGAPTWPPHRHVGRLLGEQRQPTSVGNDRRGDHAAHRHTDRGVDGERVINPDPLRGRGGGLQLLGEPLGADAPARPRAPRSAAGVGFMMLWVACSLQRMPRRTSGGSIDLDPDRPST
jgi:hypothetical protein